MIDRAPSFFYARHQQFAALFAVGMFLGSCATAPSLEQCAGADWRRIGEIDGLAGERQSASDDFMTECAALQIAPDREAYLLGYEEGLAGYCTPAGGFEAGRSGLDYKDVCAAEVERAFLLEYNLGARLFELTNDYDKAVKRYKDTVERINKLDYNLIISENRYRDSNIANEDREIARQDIEYNRREIAKLRQDLPLLNAEIDRARDRLDDYRRELNRIRN